MSRQHSQTEEARLRELAIICNRELPAITNDYVNSLLIGKDIQQIPQIQFCKNLHQRMIQAGDYLCPVRQAVNAADSELRGILFRQFSKSEDKLFQEHEQWRYEQKYPPEASDAERERELEECEDE